MSKEARLASHFGQLFGTPETTRVAALIAARLPRRSTGLRIAQFNAWPVAFGRNVVNTASLQEIHTDWAPIR